MSVKDFVAIVQAILENIPSIEHREALVVGV
jgi:hypothetical protein